MPMYTISIGEQFTIVFSLHQTPCGCHLKGHTDGTVECGPGIAIARVMGIKGFSGEVIKIEPIKS